MRLAPVLVLVAASLFAVGCNTYSNNLVRSREAFEQNQHERALAILRALETDQNHLTPGEQAEYAYLRGMTDYRIGYQSDARHWLSVAFELDKANPKSLNEDWKARMNQVLEELNKHVFNEGYASLGNTPAAKGDDSDDAEPKKGAKKKPSKNDADKPKSDDKSDKRDTPKSDSKSDNKSDK
jgi:hypothetical protein